VSLEANQQQEIERLRQIIAWCRPRLKLAVYRQTLDQYVTAPAAPDHTPIVRSTEIRHER
jgi:hypothetical protein